MNHAAACKIVIEFRDVIYAAIVRAGQKFGRQLSRDDKDDLATDITIVLLERALAKYSGAIKIRSFVWMVADREARKALVKIRPTCRYDENAEDDEPAHVEASDTSDTATQVAARIEYAHLTRALAALSAWERALLEAMAEGSTREYAAAQGMTPVQMTRAKSKIRMKILDCRR